MRTKLSKVKKQRKGSGSKDKISIKGSREKSEKCLSKASDTSQTKKRKISSTKNRSFNAQEIPRDTREKQHVSHKQLTGSRDSPVGRKTGKSRSQERKKDPLTVTKLYTTHHESSGAIVVPRVPKTGVLPHRGKSPAMRER